VPFVSISFSKWVAVCLEVQMICAIFLGQVIFTTTLFLLFWLYLWKHYLFYKLHLETYKLCVGQCKTWILSNKSSKSDIRKLQIATSSESTLHIHWLGCLPPESILQINLLLNNILYSFVSVFINATSLYSFLSKKILQIWWRKINISPFALFLNQ
jgi:hypothetical protein